ncbi:hypothetical protein IWX50DRAFT_626189 [Phyllosticta citricarpa]
MEPVCTVRMHACGYPLPHFRRLKAVDDGGGVAADLTRRHYCVMSSLFYLSFFCCSVIIAPSSYDDCVGGEREKKTFPFMPFSFLFFFPRLYHHLRWLSSSRT